MRLLQEPWCYLWKDVKRMSWPHVKKMYLDPARKLNQANKFGPECDPDRKPPTKSEFRGFIKREQPKISEAEISRIYNNLVENWGK